MTNLLPERYKCFDDLPNNIKKKMKTVTNLDLDHFIKLKMPDLQDRSVLEVMNDKNGEENVIIFLNGLICGPMGK